MNANYELKTEKNNDDKKENDKLEYFPETPSKKNQYPLIAGILLILAGITSLISWISYFSIDVSTIEQSGVMSQFQQINPDITSEEVLGFLKTCATIGIIISIFPFLGGILAIKRKLFGIAVACSIIGLFSLGMLFSSSIFSFIALILLILSRKEFKKI